MGPSLRLRIWLTYGILILVVLSTLSCGLVFTLSRSPLLYRNAIQQVHQGITAIQSKTGTWLMADQRILENELQWIATNRGLRVFLTDKNGNVTFDSVSPSDTTIGTIKGFVINDQSTNSSSILLPEMKDSKGTYWFYSAYQIQANQYVIVSVARPRLVLRLFLGDELLLPLLIAAAIALFLAFALSIFLNKWISDPLKRLSQDAAKLADGELVSVSQQGPAEIQQLAASLNEMSQKIKSSSESQRDFIANITHELKTPLTSIQGFAQSILDGTVNRIEEVKQSARIIFDEAGRMNRLVHELLTIARLESGTADLQKTEIDLGLMLATIVEQFSIVAGHKKIELQNTLHVLPKIIGDGDRLAQVFTNLFDNAIKFTPAGGKVILSGSVSVNLVEVRVVDTGPGILTIEKERIFERFYQADKSRKGEIGKGVGLGLPIAKQIVQAHHGKIWVEGEPGSGSTFIVQLPISAFQAVTRVLS